MVTFDPNPTKAGSTWRIVAMHPSGQREDISGFHTSTEAVEWLTSDACAAWLRTRGYPPDAFPAYPPK
jgi:hypothetical protein